MSLPPPEAEKGPLQPRSPHTDGLTDLWLSRLPQHSSSSILSSKRKPGLSGLLLSGGFGGLQKHWRLPFPLCGRERTDSLNESETTSLWRSEACHYCLHVLLANVLLFVSKLTVFRSPAFSVHGPQSWWDNWRFLLSFSGQPLPTPPHPTPPHPLFCFVFIFRKCSNHCFSHHHCSNHWDFLF